MSNPIKNWSYDKPTEPGLYLVCNGDVETERSIQPFRLVHSCPDCIISDAWPTYSVAAVAEWKSSFKFARLRL